MRVSDAGATCIICLSKLMKQFAFSFLQQTKNFSNRKSKRKFQPNTTKRTSHIRQKATVKSQHTKVDLKTMVTTETILFKEFHPIFFSRFLRCRQTNFKRFNTILCNKFTQYSEFIFVTANKTDDDFDKPKLATPAELGIPKLSFYNEKKLNIFEHFFLCFRLFIFSCFCFCSVLYPSVLCSIFLSVFRLIFFSFP